MQPALAFDHLSKTYGEGELAETALRDASLTVERGQSCVLLGPSGSGKTTLLSILGCLLSPSSGELRLDGEAIDLSSAAIRQELRRTKIGFVFQHAQLLPFLSVFDNLRVVAGNSGLERRDAESRVRHLADRLGILPYLARKPGQLSGGQRQRVAIARAVLHRPTIILADEPTSALDWHNGQAAMQLLIDEAEVAEAVLITVTHDTRLVGMFDRVIRVDGGSLYEDAA